MGSQTYKPTDVLKLEIEEDTTGLANLVENPDGELGGWGWITPPANVAMSGADWTDDASALKLTVSAAVNPAYFTTEALPMAAGQYVGARIQTLEVSALLTVRWRFVFLNAAGAVISSSAQTGAAGATIAQVSGTLAPAGTVAVQLRGDLLYNGAAAIPTGKVMWLRNVVVAVAATSASLGSVRTNLFQQPSAEGATTAFAAYGSQAHVTTGLTAADGCPIYNRAKVVGVNPLSANVSIGVAMTMTAPVEVGRDYAVQVHVAPWVFTAARTLVLVARGLNASGAATTTQTVLDSVTLNPGDGYAQLDGVWTPPSSVAERLQLIVYTNGNVPLGEKFVIDGVMVEQASAVGTYFDGATPDAGGVDYAWSGTADNSTSTATVAGALPFIPPVTYLDVLGPTHSIEVNREELQVGTLTATIRDASLAPYQADGIRPGRRCRLMVRDGDNPDVWRPLFTGKVLNGKVTFDKLKSQSTSPKRAKVEITAIDNIAPLSQEPRAEGVATVAELPYVLEGAGVPWNVNGSGDQVPTATVVAVNENATALDQVALTRDSMLGHAWVDRFNVLQAYDPNLMPGAGTYETLGPDEYTDLEVDYDTDSCINQVTIKFLRYDAVTGETAEVPYGPYVDADSVDQWVAHAAEFTIQWADEDPVAIAAHAQAILDANSTPQVRVLSVTVPILSTDQMRVAPFKLTALLDLCANVRVIEYLPEVEDTTLRVASIRHSITAKARGAAWIMQVGFASVGAVAPPQVTPRPPAGGGGQTLTQLLRPIGEVTMWYGTAAACPAGWLIMDGSAIPAEYPELIALVGAVLPNMTDRFPIGAGAKALGASGGAAVSNMPEHTHTINGQAAGTSWLVGNTGANSAVRINEYNGHAHGGATAGIPGANPDIDIMPPWRALWFIIRAK